MNKIVSNGLVVSIHLIIGGLFLFMLFGNDNDSSQVVVVDNSNLNKMADSVSELFTETEEIIIDYSEEEELFDANQNEVVEEQPVIDNEKTIEEENVIEEEPQVLVSVDASGYSSIPALGFNVTIDNKVYELSDEDFKILAAVVSCEAKKTSKDDILAVMSVILNRTDSSRYPNDPVSVVAAPNQFSCYKGLSIEPNELVASVMRDALNGVRNNKYYGFRSWQTVSYSNNYIVDGGNRYA